jgi:hypothetical protein
VSCGDATGAALGRLRYSNQPSSPRRRFINPTLALEKAKMAAAGMKEVTEGARAAAETAAAKAAAARAAVGRVARSRLDPCTGSGTVLFGSVPLSTLNAQPPELKRGLITRGRGARML